MMPSDARADHDRIDSAPSPIKWENGADDEPGVVIRLETPPLPDPAATADGDLPEEMVGMYYHG